MIGEVSSASVACGVLGVGGNKGAVAVSFSLFRRKVAVICSHFAAHQVPICESLSHLRLSTACMFSTHARLRARACVRVCGLARACVWSFLPFFDMDRCGWKDEGSWDGKDRTACTACAFRSNFHPFLPPDIERLQSNLLFPCLGPLSRGVTGSCGGEVQILAKMLR